MEAAQAQRSRYLDFSRLRRNEYFGFAAALLLFISLFLPYFSTNPGSNGSINGLTGEFTAFETYGILDILLVAACAAPFILAFIIARGHKLSWRPGEVTAIVGLTAFVLILLNGVILGKPGEPPGVISFEIGYPLGLLGAAGIAVSGFVRQLDEAEKKPPGV
jgi:hypothetical protein